MHFLNQGKYFTVTKSTTFAPFCHPYLNPITFTSFFTRIPAINILKIFLEKPETPHACILLII